MDFLYSELPEIVYDPADLTGSSFNGTVQLTIDNDKRAIDIGVLKTPGKLTILDPNQNKYSFDGSVDTVIDISNFFGIEIEYKVATEEDIAQNIPTASSKVGDGYFKITASGTVAYAPIPMPVAASSDIQKITSISKIYNSVTELPANAIIGSIYPVSYPTGIVLYEKTTSGVYNPKANVSSGTVYVVLDTGLLALATSSFDFQELNSALNSAINSLMLTLSS